MTNLKFSKQKKLMAEARGSRRERLASKRDLMGIQTQTLKRKNLDAIKVAPIVSEPQPASIPPSGDSKSGSPKKMKTLMNDNVSQADLTITTMMQDSGTGHQSRASSGFKL